MVGLPGQELLHNQYWFLRHGRSIPNESGLIVSLLSNGVLPQHGLAPTGFVQAKLAGELLLKDFQGTGIPADNLKIYSSPFSRTKQTAEAVMEVLEEKGIHPTIKFVEDLRERYFGPPLELQSSEHYDEIWDIDFKDPMVGPEGGESAADVARRTANVIAAIDKDVQGCAILIVSHGDPLQILQTVIAQALCRKAAEGDTLSGRLHEAIDPFILKQHLKFPMNTGELRRLA
ncbi:unnamed protein product [Calypogeia fissa]